MSDLTFISEVVYDLKIDYGEAVSVGRETFVINIETGIKTPVQTQIDVPLAIVLPKEKRHSFLRTIGSEKILYLQPEQQEFIIDKADLTQSILPLDYIIWNGRKLKISVFEDYHHAYYIIANNG